MSVLSGRMRISTEISCIFFLFFSLNSTLLCCWCWLHRHQAAVCWCFSSASFLFISFICAVFVFTCLSFHHRGWWGKYFNYHLKINQACVDVILWRNKREKKLVSYLKGIMDTREFTHLDIFLAFPLWVISRFDLPLMMTHSRLEFIFGEGDLATQLLIWCFSQLLLLFSHKLVTFK